MTDYSVHMQCQAQTDKGVRCTRRGRLHSGEEYYFCWQHSAFSLRWAPDFRAIAIYPPQLMPG
jgi:hypothetical protein